MVDEQPEVPRPMLTVLTERECKDAFKESVLRGIAARGDARVGIDDRVLDEFLELLTFEWIELIETTPSGDDDVNDFLGCFGQLPSEQSDATKVRSKKAKAVDLPFPGSFELPLAARGLPASFLGYRQVRVQEYLFNFALDTTEGLFANPESIPFKLLLGRQVAGLPAGLPIDSLGSAVSVAVLLVIAVVRTNYGKPKLNANERCLYVKMWYHELSGGYSVEAMQTWFTTRCDIPARRYWRCAYRVKGNECEIDASAVAELAEGLCDKGFFRSKASDTPAGRELKLYSLKLR